MSSGNRYLPLFHVQYLGVCVVKTFILTYGFLTVRGIGHHDVAASRRLNDTVRQVVEFSRWTKSVDDKTFVHRYLMRGIERRRKASKAKPVFMWRVSVTAANAREAR